MPHKCHGNGGNCPSRSHPTIWEMPINELDRRDDPDFDENLTGCHLVSSCSNIYHKEQFRRLLQHNFDRHYNSNKVRSLDCSPCSPDMTLSMHNCRHPSLCRSRQAGWRLIRVFSMFSRSGWITFSCPTPTPILSPSFRLMSFRNKNHIRLNISRLSNGCKTPQVSRF